MCPAYRLPSCPEAIRRFLGDPENGDSQTTMRALGLDPEHVTPLNQPNSLETIEFFIEALKGYPEGHKLLTTFQRLYNPDICPGFTERLGNEEKEEEIRNTLRIDPCRDMKAFLGRKIVGQSYAIDTISEALMSDSKNVTALLVGPTGVGKTELVRAIAHYRKATLTEFHMNQFHDEYQVSTLFGSAIGISGSDGKPTLAAELDKATNKEETPAGIKIKNHVLLFDEIEKAHPQVKASLLTLLNEGRCTVRFTERGIVGAVNKSITYILEGCTIFCTSNAYHNTIIKASQAGLGAADIIAAFKAANAHGPVNIKYSEEFLGRLTIVPFTPISRADHKILLRNKIDTFCPLFAGEIGCHSIEFMWSPRESLLTELHDKFYGTGVDLRCIERDLLKRLEGFIQATKAQWGELSNIALYIDKQHPTAPIELQARFRDRISGYERALKTYVINCWD